MKRSSVRWNLIFIGVTPIVCSSKRLDAVETSNYGVKFCAMCTVTKESIAVQYNLRGLGVMVEQSSYMFEDALGVIQNATIKDSLLKMKHVWQFRITKCARQWLRILYIL